MTQPTADHDRACAEHFTQTLAWAAGQQYECWIVQQVTHPGPDRRNPNRMAAFIGWNPAVAGGAQLEVSVVDHQPEPGSMIVATNGQGYHQFLTDPDPIVILEHVPRVRPNRSGVKTVLPAYVVAGAQRFWASQPPAPAVAPGSPLPPPQA